MVPDLCAVVREHVWPLIESGEAEAIVMTASGCGAPAGAATLAMAAVLVLLDAKGVPLAEVLAELDRREGTSGIAEKAARGSLGSE